MFNLFFVVSYFDIDYFKHKLMVSRFSYIDIQKFLYTELFFSKIIPLKN